MQYSSIQAKCDAHNQSKCEYNQIEYTTLKKYMIYICIGLIIICTALCVQKQKSKIDGTSSTEIQNEQEQSEIVYITDTGNKYHRASCSYLNSKHSITKENAIKRGYTACSKCNP